MCAAPLNVKANRPHSRHDRRVLDGFFDVAQAFLRLAFDFFDDALDLLGGAADGLAYVFLHFSSGLIDNAFHLIFVHAMHLLVGLAKGVRFKLQPVTIGA